MKLLAYCVMSNHFHVFVYIGRPEPLSDAEIVRRISALYSDVRFEQVMKKWNELTKRPDSPSFRRCWFALTKDGRRRIERVAPL